MADVLIVGDTGGSPELRHELPLGVPDPFVYLERGGERHVYVSSIEAGRISAVAPGVTVHPMEEIGSDELAARGPSLLELGHGAGLEVHEQPQMGRLPGGVLLAGDVITLEPGLYDPAAVGGVRLEDIVLVTDDGCEVLTRFPYDLEVAAR